MELNDGLEVVSVRTQPMYGLLASSLIEDAESFRSDFKLSQPDGVLVRGLGK